MKLILNIKYLLQYRSLDFTCNLFDSSPERMLAKWGLPNTHH